MGQSSFLYPHANTASEELKENAPYVVKENYFCVKIYQLQGFFEFVKVVVISHGHKTMASAWVA